MFYVISPTSKMAYIMRNGLGLLTIKNAKNVVPRTVLLSRYQKLLFHTSWILDVKGKELFMPALSPTMEQGVIVKWLKKEGDSINPGDAVADIQTDKAVMALEIEDEIVLAKIILENGKTAKVGDLIALTVDQGEDWKSVEMPSGVAGADSVTSSSSSSSESETESTIPEEPPAGQTNITMPALSPTMTSGTIVKWLKKEGDKISPGDALAEIQTDKAVMTFEVDEESVLAKIIASDGSQVDVGSLIAILVEEGMDISSIVIPSVKKSVPKPKTSSDASSTSKPTQQESSRKASSSTKPPPSGQVYGLAVKRLLEEYDLSSGSIKGTGRPNRLLKGDVLDYIQINNVQKVAPKTATTIAKTGDQPKSTAPASKWKGGPSTFVDVPVSNIRGVIAKRLGESKSSIPHSYASIDINIDKLNDIRTTLRAENIKVSVNDFVVKAVAHALSECPDVNSIYQNGQAIRQHKVDISVAVAAPTGLITPIVFDTTSKSLTQISEEIKKLALKAKEGKLQPHEFQGGTFTISNLGMFGIKEFSAIINPPQTAILAVGTGRPLLDSSLQRINMMAVTLSYDRRAVDEEQAADFLAVLQAMLQDPNFLAVGRLHSLRHSGD